MSHDEPLPARVEGWAWDVGITPANYFVPTPHRYAYLHLLGEISALFGVATVVYTYFAATLLGATGRIRFGATRATAALPQFTFIPATVNPDSLAAALASIALVLRICVAKSSGPRRRAVAALGAVSPAPAFLVVANLSSLWFVWGAFARA